MCLIDLILGAQVSTKLELISFPKPKFKIILTQIAEGT